MPPGRKRPFLLASRTCNAFVARVSGTRDVPERDRGRSCRRAPPLALPVPVLHYSSAMLRFTVILIAFSAFAADSDFNGRWDITTTTRRAYWLELTGVGTPKPSGFF